MQYAGQTIYKNILVRSKPIGKYFSPKQADWRRRHTAPEQTWQQLPL